MKNLLKKITDVVLKDIFKPNYVLIVQTERLPDPIALKSGIASYMYVPCIALLPIKRPLNMSYKEFQRRISDKYRLTTMRIYLN